MNVTTSNAMNSTVMFDNMTSAPPTSNSTNPEDPEAYLYQLGTDLFIPIDIVIVLVGCIGNALSFIVSTRKTLRKSPVSIFLAALAVADTLVLVLDFLNNWLSLQLNVYLMGNYGFCLIHRWFFNVCYTTSAWYIVGVTFERFVAINFPLQARLWCTVRNSVIAVICMPVIIGVFYLYNFWMWTVGEDSGKCEPTRRHEMFMNDVSPWLTAVLYSYIPVISIVFCNIGIIMKLTQAKSRRERMTGDAAKDGSKTHKVTVTVLAISLAYMITTVPLTVWYIYAFATQNFVEQGPRHVFIEICILILGLMNHAINFFLYVMTSEQFRSELASLFRCSFKLPALWSESTSAGITQKTSRTTLSADSQASNSQVQAEVDSQAQVLA